MNSAKRYLCGEVVGVAVYLEKTKARQFVGELKYTKTNSEYEFSYDERYLQSKDIIPLGPELPLRRKVYSSPQLFESFADRLPSKENPAYPEYCQSVGIDVDEKDPLILLSTIGRRGPSSFVFEPVYENKTNLLDLKAYREELGLTTREFAICFDVSQKSIINIENKKSSGRDVIKRLELYLRFPEVALFEFRRNCGGIHINKRRSAEKILWQKIG